MIPSKLSLAAVLFLCAHFLAAAETKPPLMRDFIGLNGHTTQFRPKLYQPIARYVRDYHPAYWDLEEETSKLPRFPISKNKVNWDAVYGSWKADGWTIDASLMFESVKQDLWKNFEADAQAYGMAFAKAFGPSSPHALVQSAEVGNEPGKWSDADFIKMSKAMATGLRAGDPKLTITTCNLTTGKSTGNSKSVKCIEHQLDLYDVLAIHTYAMVEFWPTWRRSYPEDPKLIDYLTSVQDLCKWRDAHAPKKPIWITEFGYDSSTKKAVPKGDFAKWVGVTDRQQAQWLVRSLLVFSAMPIERAYVYFFDDDDEPSLHASSGITRHFVPKPSYYALEHLQSALGGYRFSRIVENRAGDLRIHEYRSDSGGLAWAVWSPTGSDRHKTVSLPLFPGRLTRAERMPAAGKPPEKLAIPTTRTIDLTEDPAYLFFTPN